MIHPAIIFPWNENFDTGIAVVDEQHRKLVDLLNNLASHLAYGAEAPELNRVFEELADYALYHFKTEEAIWNKWLPETELSLAHIKTHQDFVGEVLKLKSDLDTLGKEKVMDEMVSFLTHWLAFHILEADKHMAKIILALQQGASLDEAKEIAQGEMSGAMRVLIETVLKMYDSLSSRTLALMREIAERQRVEQSLRLSKNVIDSTIEAIFVTDENMRIIDTNPSFCHQVMQEHQKLIGKRVTDVMPTLFSPDKTDEILAAVGQSGHWTGEIIGRNNENELEAVWLTLSAIKDPQGPPTQFVGLLSSVSQLLERHQGLVEAANHDTLTGLPNRRLLEDRISQAITRSDRSRKMLAICFLDLDGFKQINDTFGHDAGDEVLRSVAARLVKALRGDDTVARIGGDEFVLLFGELEGEQDISPLLDRLLKDVAQPISTGDNTVSVTASIGVTFYPKDAPPAEALLQHADAAMYDAKNKGKSQYRFYQPSP